MEMDRCVKPQCVESSGAMIGRIGEITLTQTLEDKENQLKQRLADIQRARQILKENPTLAELHNLLMRIR